MITQEDRIAKVKSLSGVELARYLEAIHKSTLDSRLKSELLEICESRIEKRDMSNAFVEQTDMDDFGGH